MHWGVADQTFCNNLSAGRVGSIPPQGTNQRQKDRGCHRERGFCFCLVKRLCAMLKEVALALHKFHYFPINEISIDRERERGD